MLSLWANEVLFGAVASGLLGQTEVSPGDMAGACERPYRTGTNQLACFARAATKDYHLQAGAGAINDGTVRLKR
jgi:hypothetical protein